MGVRMPLKERQEIIQQIEKLRPGRRIVGILNFDRAAEPAQIPGLGTSFQEDMKEPLFRVLKETIKDGSKLDVLLYTRGGATNAVWPIAGLLREFDPDFHVLVPFRAHSSGTMLALAAKQIVMTRLSELSPIDPTTANQFNPQTPDRQILGIAVEDVTAYKEFWQTALPNDPERALQYLGRLATEIHPLALGNVQRVYMQIKKLAKMLLSHHYGDDTDKIDKIIDLLTKEFYSHSHMIGRQEAKDILGEDHIVFAPAEMEELLDALLRQYENDFELRHKFVLCRFMAEETEKTARFVGGVVESGTWSYLNDSTLKVRQFIAPPQNVQIQVPAGAPVPLIPGIPRKFEWQVMQQSWTRNKEPKGVTI